MRSLEQILWMYLQGKKPIDEPNPEVESSQSEHAEIHAKPGGFPRSGAFLRVFQRGTEASMQMMQYLKQLPV